MLGKPTTTTRVLLSAVAAMTIGLGVTSVVVGPSDYLPVRLLQGIAVFAAGAALIGGAVVLAVVYLAGWRDPESEEDFERLVVQAERLAQQGLWGDDGDVDEDEPLPVDDDEDFKALVRSAVDDLPLEFHRALEHVAIVIDDEGGARHRAYGLYQGDTVARDFFHDRIVIFKDTLLRDFGHDPELLKAQVTRTVRHELAHHLGWGEKGVRGLGL